MRARALRVFTVEMPPPLLRDAGPRMAAGSTGREPTCTCTHIPACKS